MKKNALSLNIPTDLVAGLVVFFVALPLCLGVALASNAPLFSGLLGGIIGGIVIGSLSGSSTSVSGPAAGLTAIVAAQIHFLGTFEAFLTAVVIAGIFQIILSIAQMGYLAAFFPSNVIKGLLWAIGAILVLKQIPHLFGHDVDPIGNKAFFQADNKNTFTEILETLSYIHPGALFIGVVSIFILVFWDKIALFKKSGIPAPLVVIAIGVALKFAFQNLGEMWYLTGDHLVQVPIAKSVSNVFDFLMFPDWSILNNSAVYTAGATIAAVASLETLLNLEAVDKLDPHQRQSPPNRELFAQGLGNIVGGLIGALPVTSVIVRSSVNINAGATSKLSAIFHGVLLLLSVVFIPQLLNEIPLSALAAILLVTGLKLANPQLVMQMWNEGKNQFLPFFVTIVAIIFSDLLVGVLIGLATSIFFILRSNIRRPIKTTLEKHATGDEVLHIELPNQVSFFNKAALESTLKHIRPGGHVLINANNTDYIDPDILDLIIDYQSNTSVTKDVHVSLVGFRDRYPQLQDKIKYVDYSSREVQENLTPERILEILREGNARFREGVRLTRDLGRQLNVTSSGQFPMAVILSCIDSRSPVELIFDLSLGDAFSVRIAGNVVSTKILGSIEYGCAVIGAKLILVMGHTSCGAVKASVDITCSHQTASEATGCVNLDSLVSEIQECVNPEDCEGYEKWTSYQKDEYLNEIAYKNVLRTIQKIRENSSTIDTLVKEGKVAIVGAMYNISTAKVSFFYAPEDGMKMDDAGEFVRKQGFKSGIKNSIKKFLRKFGV